MRPLFAVSILAATVATAACGRAPAQPAPAPALVAAPTVGTTSSSPPSGTYSVSTRVVTDDCGVATASTQRGLLVAAAAEHGVVRINVPMPTASPGGATTTARSDFTLGAAPRVHETTPDPACPAYTVTRSTELRNAGAEGFEVVATTSYGDAGACASAAPQRCTTSVIHQFTLTEFACSAECSRGHRFVDDPQGGPPQWQVECRCS
ncbi:MAG: hypothetical protein IPN32_08860 [Deltaproteobacteria bacterium]|nr:hypothetical protein [Deltaproteobacteria bacterium]